MFHMANDSHRFHTEPRIGVVALYEAKLFHQFDHRYSTYAGASQEQLNENVLPRMSSECKADPTSSILPRYWVDQTDVDARVPPRVPRALRHAYQSGEPLLVQDAYLLWAAGHH